MLKFRPVQGLALICMMLGALWASQIVRLQTTSFHKKEDTTDGKM